MLKINSMMWGGLACKGRVRRADAGRSGASGGEPLWIVPKRPRDICLGACRTANLFKRAAPENVSTRVRFVYTLNG